MKKTITLEHVALNTPFRGNRNYVQSSSIYNELFKSCKSIIDKNIWIKQLKLNQFANTQCYATTIVDAKYKIIGSFSLVCFESIVEGFIATKKDIPILLREEFNEEKIVLNSVVFDQGVECDWQENTSFIDQCVALTKHFHNALFPLEDKKWIYTRLTMKEDVSFLKPKTISISLNRKLGERMTQSSVLLDGKEYGTIEFSVH